MTKLVKILNASFTIKDGYFFPFLVGTLTVPVLLTYLLIFLLN